MARAEHLIQRLDSMTEKWGETDVVNPKEKGKYDGWSQEDLTKKLHSLKAAGPHKKGTKEFGQMKELQFALRAKGAGGKKWGKVE